MSYRQRLIAFLRWTERYTKTDMVYLLHSGFWMLLSQAILFILSFLLLWVFANLLDREAYGQYRFLITVITILSFTSLTGMATAVIRAVARGTGGIIHQATKTRFLYSFSGTIIALVGSGYYFYQENSFLGQAFLLIAAIIPFFESFSLYYAHLLGRKDYPHFAAISIVQKIFVLIPTVLAILLNQPLLIIFVSYIGSTALINIALYHLTLKLWPPTSQTDTETIPYGKQLSWMSMMGAVSENLDKIALWYLMGPLEVAIYTIAISLPKEVSGAFAQIGIIALPKMANREKNILQQSLLRKMGVFFLVTIPIFTIYLLATPTIFKIFLPQYLDSILYTQISGLLILFTPVVLLGQYFNATANTKALYAQQFVLPVILITLFIILIPTFGILGAVMALLGKQLASLLLFTYYLYQDRKDTFNN